MIGLDTNVLVRYLVADEEQQLDRLERYQEKASNARWHLDHIVLCETVWVLRSAYGFDRRQISDALDQLLETRQISIRGRDQVRKAARAYSRGQGDFADHLIGLRNREAGCTETLTFDKALARDSAFRML